MAEPLSKSEEQTLRDEFKRNFTQGPGPFAEASLLSKLMFGWLTPIIEVSQKVEFTQDLHFKLRESDKSVQMTEIMEANWKKYHPEAQVKPGTKTPVLSFYRAVWDSTKMQMVMGIFLQFLQVGMEFYGAYLVYNAIEIVQQVDYSQGLAANSDKLWSVSYIMVWFVFLRILGSAMGLWLSFYLSIEGMKIRNSLMNIIFKKLLRKGTERDNTFDLADITNLTQVDAATFSDLGARFGEAFAIPLRLLGGVIALGVLMGRAIFPSLFVLALVSLGNIVIMNFYKKYKDGYMQASDLKGKLINEIFRNIKFIKMQGLENYYLLKLRELREQELFWVWRQFCRNIAANSNNLLGPELFMLVLYVTKLVLTGNLRLSEALVSSIIFSIFSATLRNFGHFFVFLMDTVISAKRINFFLLSEELDTKYITYSQSIPSETDRNTNVAIQIKKGNFYSVDEQAQELYAQEKAALNEGLAKDPENAAKYSPSDKRRSKGCFCSTIQANNHVSMLPSTSLETGPRICILCQDRQPLLGDDEINMRPLEKSRSLVLRDINLEIPEGLCVAVIGTVGSGKSSLLNCLLGELYYEEGTSVTLKGTISYVSQKPWISSMTVKDVILFGSEFNKEKFDKCIKLACLNEDLDTMTQGIDTMLGDRGVNLSGGQKTRVAIARALYADRDIYLFDDPISALDVNVGKLVMEEAILKHLKGKTRLVATHALNYLPYFDHIIVMDGGKIVKVGGWDTIKDAPQVYLNFKRNTEKDQEGYRIAVDSAAIADQPSFKPRVSVPNKRGTKKSSGSELRPELIKNKPSEMEETMQIVAEGGKTKTDEIIDSIIASEDKSKGDVVTVDLLRKYIAAAGGSWFLWWMGPSILAQASVDVAYNWYIQYSTRRNISSDEVSSFGWTLFIMIMANSVSGIGRNLPILWSNWIRSRKTFFQMSFRMLHASLNEFLDRVPIGRVMNRFMRDVNIMDLELGFFMDWMFLNLTNILSDLFVAVYASSIWMLVFVAFYVVISWKLQRLFMLTNREVSRLKSICSSPMIQTISEATTGTATVRVFQNVPWIVQRYVDQLDEFQKNSIVSDALSKWFQLRLFIFSAVIMVPCIWMNLLWVQTGAGMFALLIRYMMMLTTDINGMMNHASGNEGRLISFERCSFFTNIPSEKGYKKLGNCEAELFDGKMPTPQDSSAWPLNGEIQIHNLAVCYRPGLPQSLKGLSFFIPSGTKVGVVGRTGAGKSTLFNCLYRYFDEYEGDVIIAGRELRTVDLKLLRSSMTVLPQDPYLFADSVRNNLDPLGRHTDADVEVILREVDLWDKMGSGLTTQIDSSGSNLSQGEKQLLCLARALLQNNHVVLMDEATANIDSQSEQTIQRLLRDRFLKATIFMIAHRLNTVLQCDRILVLDGGRVVEYDTLAALKSNPNSRFSKLINDHEEIHQSLT